MSEFSSFDAWLKLSMRPAFELLKQLLSLSSLNNNFCTAERNSRLLMAQEVSSKKNLRYFYDLLVSASEDNSMLLTPTLVLGKVVILQWCLVTFVYLHSVPLSWVILGITTRVELSHSAKLYAENGLWAQFYEPKIFSSLSSFLWCTENASQCRTCRLSNLRSLHLNAM